MGPRLLDKDWVRQAFIVNASELDEIDRQNRTFSSVQLKFTDTTPGGNFSINPPPQFTRFADLKPEIHGAREKNARMNSRKIQGPGMGRYYSEAIDDNQQIIYMRFGVPQFNSLTSFFSGFYNTDAGRLARTGRGFDAFFTVGKAVGYVVPLLSWPLFATAMVGYVTNRILSKPRSRYYYLKPTMNSYWTAVQTIINQITVNAGIVPRLGPADGADGGWMKNYSATEAERTNMYELHPEIFSEKYKSSVDAYAIATRAQRMARRQEARFQELQKNMAKSTEEVVRGVYTEKYSKDEGMGYHTYMTMWLKSAQTMVQADTEAQLGGLANEMGSGFFGANGTTTPAGTESPTGASEGGSAPNVPPTQANTTGPATKVGAAFTEPMSNKPEGWAGFWELMKAEWDDGSAFAAFRVDATSGINESFSSQVGESEIQSKFNGISSQARSTSFSFAGGNVSNGIVGTTIQGAMSAVKSFVEGALEGVGMSGLMALGGAAFVDIPKHWQSSSANLPRLNYTITLTCPYNNPMSRLLNMYLPLAMLLAAALPLSTGKQSYTSPFLLELYDRGRGQVRLGMIDNLSITRGIHNTAFTNEGLPLGIEVSFSVVDMSSIIHLPISQGFSLGNAVQGAIAGAAGGLAGAATEATGSTALGNAITAVGGWASDTSPFDDDSAFSDYMNVLGSVGLADQIYYFRKLKLQMTQKALQYDSWNDINAWTNWLGNATPLRHVSAIFRGTAR